MDPKRYHFTFDPRKKGLRKILGDLEADVMEAIWACGRATVRDVHERLTAADRELAYTTAMTRCGGGWRSPSPSPPSRRSNRCRMRSHPETVGP